MTMQDPSNPASLSSLPLADIVARCGGERRAFYTQQVQVSPACVEMVRRAFANDQQAWAAVSHRFYPNMRSWAKTYAQDDVDDLLQDALSAFMRSAPKQPELVHTDSLAPVLGYLRRCVKTAIARRIRKPEVPQVPLDHVPELEVASPVDDTVDLRAQLAERLVALVTDAQEHAILILYFFYELTPREIVARQGDLFPHTTDVQLVLQRLKRRLSNDATIQSIGNELLSSRRRLRDSDHLEIRAGDAPGEVRPMDDECHLDQDVLFAYAIGEASTTIRRAVEQSPVCLTIVQHMQQELLSLHTLLYRLECPTPEELVAYQEGRLASTDHLTTARHVAECPHCGADLRLLADIDQLPLEPEPPLRRLVAAIFQPPLQLALRGDMLRYETPEQVVIDLKLRRVEGPVATWRLVGQVRLPNNAAAADLEAVLERPDQPPHVAAVKADGRFTLESLAAGTYQLRLLLPETEIVIADLKIGDGAV